jgi:hypothetical protein
MFFPGNSVLRAIKSSYISKDIFLFGFNDIWRATISEANVKSAFRSSAFITLGLMKVINEYTSNSAVEPRTNVGIQNKTKYERTGTPKHLPRRRFVSIK